MMRRLTAIDADMLAAEQPTWHLHVGGVIVLDPTRTRRRLSFDAWRRELAARIDRIPPLCERIVPVPLGIDRPMWVRDRPVDLDAHVHYVKARGPAGYRELADLAGDLVGRKLDRDRPLWEMWFVDGLAGRRVAVVAKVHHAAVDGVAAALLLGQLLDPSPVSDAGSTPAPAVPAEHPPSRLALAVEGLGSLATSPLRMAGPLARTVGSVGAVRRLRMVPASGAPALPFRGPRTNFNRPVTANRSVALATVSLAEVKAVKNAFGTTVNDVVLAVCASALRRYLQLQDQHPAAPLTAAVPVSTRTTLDAATYGNRVSGLFTSLPVDVEDAVERLAATSRAAVDAKRLYATRLEDTLIDWADVPPPFAMSFATRLYTWARLGERMPPVFNLLVSNVAGSPSPLYLAGVPVEAIYPLGPVLDGVGLNISILSYADRIGFGLVSCPELMPDLWDLADAIPPALAELVAASTPRAADASRQRGDARDPARADVVGRGGGNHLALTEHDDGVRQVEHVG